MVNLFALAPALLSLIASVYASLGTCFYPDGKTTAPGHVPCNQTISTPSACCDPLDSCSTSGFCLGRSGWIYRGSCTDQSWGSANCARQFDQCVNNPDNNAPASGWTAVWSCAQPGIEEKKFCCGFTGESCCNSSFTLGVTGPAFKPGLDAFVLSISSAAVASATGSIVAMTTSTASAVSTAAMAEWTTSNSTCSNGDLGTKVGLGVGVPLGVLALGILGFLFWRESGKRHAAAAGASTPPPMAHGSESEVRFHQSPSQQEEVGGTYGGTYRPTPTPLPQQDVGAMYRRNPSQHSQQGDYTHQHRPSEPYSTTTVQTRDMYSPYQQPKGSPWSPAPTYEPPTSQPQELPTFPNMI
ncbi:hypothetical protein LSUE1_G005372 [Lachnellula suecica]|uniref:Uncharacterized protein n=1 Tax=Lachnellula suecica TaxID=602035 RepID=A0A8T9BZC7_9HELO|nr:hypothetical protein LSUE1_G005372 [Lachnellula suecica]